MPSKQLTPHEPAHDPVPRPRGQPRPASSAARRPAPFPTFPACSGPLFGTSCTIAFISQVLLVLDRSARSRLTMPRARFRYLLDCPAFFARTPNLAEAWNRSRSPGRRFTRNQDKASRLYRKGDSSGATRAAAPQTQKIEKLTCRNFFGSRRNSPTKSRKSPVSPLMLS